MAGLLDSLFDPSSFGGSGGLLARLQPLIGDIAQPSGFPDQSATFAQRFNAIPNAPQPFQPSGRSFDSASFDPATFAPNQAQPINVGGYQMPRLGSADLYQPSATDMSAQSRALPPNAEPTQGQLPQQPMQPQGPGPAFATSDQPGFMTAYQNLRGGGGLIGSIAAGLTGQRTDPAGIQQNNLKAQFTATRQALIDNGMDPRQASSTAMLSVLNPEAAKTVLPEALSNKTDLKLIKDEFGAEHPYSYNKNTSELKPLGGNGNAGSSGTMQQTISNLDNMPQGASQEQRLAQVPQAYRGYVKSLLAGEALPSNIGRSQLRGPLMTLAHAVDPSFDESKIPLRFKTATDYAPNGQSGRSIVALNTVQHHIGKLSDDLENLGDTGWTYGNAVWNAVAKNTPLSPAQGKATQAVQDDIKAVTDEMSAAYKAGRVSDHEIEAWNKLANSNLPLRQLKQGIYDFVGLLNGKRDQLNETHQAILGREAPGINRDLNEAITRKVTERNSEKPSEAKPSVSEGATATNPQTGQKIVFKGGKWVPVQ